MTVGTLLATSSISAGSVFATNSSISNLFVSSLTNGNLYSTMGTFATVSSSWLSATTISGSNLSLSGDLFVAGTLTSVNITTTNFVDTNMTAGIAHITTHLSAAGNSNTIGSIFTTAGNVGINNTAPSYTVDITGDLRA